MQNLNIAYGFNFPTPRFDFCAQFLGRFSGDDEPWLFHPLHQTSPRVLAKRNVDEIERELNLDETGRLNDDSAMTSNSDDSTAVSSSANRNDNKNNPNDSVSTGSNLLLLRFFQSEWFTPAVTSHLCSI